MGYVFEEKPIEQIEKNFQFPLWDTFALYIYFTIIFKCLSIPFMGY